MPRKKAIEIPDVIRELPGATARKREEESIKRQQRNKERAEQEQTKKASRKREEDRKRRATLPYARNIFSWANALRESETGRELIQTGDRVGQTGFCFFDGKPPGARQMWLGLDERGLWRHGFG